MNLKNFYQDLPAIWLVFAGSYLNHEDAPNLLPEQREKSLINLLRRYIKLELAKPTQLDLDNAQVKTSLRSVLQLLKLWSDDLTLIYQARQSTTPYPLVEQIAQRFWDRIQQLDDCTIIPNGLIAAKHNHNQENICLAIVKRQANKISWLQVDSGSAYHPHRQNLTGDESCAYLEIQNVDPQNITNEWLTLLVGLKAINPGGYYKDVSLYECLLAQLNGQTTFQPQPDESFVNYSHNSPAHRWQVIEQSLRALLQHFIGDSYHKTFDQLMLGFKLFLFEQTFTAYQNPANQKLTPCRFLLHEMCQQIAQLCLKHGQPKHKQASLQLITNVKATITKHLKQSYQADAAQLLTTPQITSLSFAQPTIADYQPNAKHLKSVALKAQPVFNPPGDQDDLITYLRHLKQNFIAPLRSSTQLQDIALLIAGIESFLISYLANTAILENSDQPFSTDDNYLATVLKELAEIYYNYQGKMHSTFFADMIYQPQLYAKNVTVQFFVYAAITALNLRDSKIGPLLAQYNLSTSANKLCLDNLLKQLVIDDRHWLKILLTISKFFNAADSRSTLFANQKLNGNRFEFSIDNTADSYNEEVKFAYKLLNHYRTNFANFSHAMGKIEQEKRNQLWANLTYSTAYLPSLYSLLTQMAFLAKSSLAMFPLASYSSQVSTSFNFNSNEREYWRTTIYFTPNISTISNYTQSQAFLSYRLPRLVKDRYWTQEDPFQRLIRPITDNDTGHNHLTENAIIASQNEKPTAMDRIHYLHLGFLQSQPLLKLARLYIAIKQRFLDFTHEQDSTLIKQTLFEVSHFEQIAQERSSLLEWTAQYNPELIHQLGLLCINKALAMKLRLTQHQAIGEVLEIALGLLTFYPDAYKKEFIASFQQLYDMLLAILKQPPQHLGANTLCYLNAYLIISAQLLPELDEQITLAVLSSLLAIQNYKIENALLDNKTHLLVHNATFKLQAAIEQQLMQSPTILNQLMLKVAPHWDTNSQWQKSHTGLLFSCGEHAVQPLLGAIYFKNQPIIGLPDSITAHKNFIEYFEGIRFTVLPASCQINNQTVACYESIDREPLTRLTLIGTTLLIEEFIDGDYQLYIPSSELLTTQHPALLQQQPKNNRPYRHWLIEDQILIKNQQRDIIYRWHLANNAIYSLAHKGYLIPLAQLTGTFLYNRLQQVELNDWIELIAEQTTEAAITFQSLHLPRLALSFDYQAGKFLSRQIQGFYLAAQQKLNTLQGFDNYFVLEHIEPGSAQQQIKIIIPHRQIIAANQFYNTTIEAKLTDIKSPTYFVYDLDQRLGLLKSSGLSAQLYLALLYNGIASFDRDSLAGCNSYHLVWEQLEACWKTQPYDETELAIIEQLLSREIRRSLHYNRVAIYLKVVAMLSHSLQLGFLYTDPTSLTNIEKSEKLLAATYETLPSFFALYLQNRAHIFARIKLSLEEERQLVKYLFEVEHNHSQQFQAYIQLYLEQQPQVTLTNPHIKNYKQNYQQLFAKDQQTATDFVRIFNDHLSYFKFSLSAEKLNFSTTIAGILVARFRIEHFLDLYQLAQSSISTDKYRYLLHHMALRAKILQDTLPQPLVMALARVLLLVAENPGQFPQLPSWLKQDDLKFDLMRRSLTEKMLKKKFPSVSSYYWSNDYEAKREKDKKENKKIWKYLSSHDLDYSHIPKSLPRDQSYFSLNYECYISFKESEKKKITRKLYLQAARNDALYQFLTSVLQRCNELKNNSTAAWEITPDFNNMSATHTLHKDVEQPQSLTDLTSLAKDEQVQWDIPQPLQFKLKQFFIKKSLPAVSQDFPFEAQLHSSQNGYQQTFYNELKASWLSYVNMPEIEYKWRRNKAKQELKQSLQTQQQNITQELSAIWARIKQIFNLKLNTAAQRHFALRWYSGQAVHFHQADVLNFILDPQKLASYKPTLADQKRVHFQEALGRYLTLEIQRDQINRALVIVDQLDKAKDDIEAASLTQRLVSCLQETIDKNSYHNPHWLLFQFEHRLIIRNNQSELILAMLEQTQKAMYQLNMGEGKSSVILPLLSYDLANSEQLLRINVLQPLFVTMYNLLQQRFSGLMKKRIYTLPFNRDTNIDTANLAQLLHSLSTCQREQHVLLTTPEQRMCLQLKLRELILENQQQLTANGIFNWQAYRQRTASPAGAYTNFTEIQHKQLLAAQDQFLKTCLIAEGYIDKNNRILKVPPRGQGRQAFAKFKEKANQTEFREWSCLTAAYRELLFNSQLAYSDSSEKLKLLQAINALNVIDLLDESDEILRHGTELNYTIGDKYLFAGGELRWLIPQFFLKSIYCDEDVRAVIIAGKAQGLTDFNLKGHGRSSVPTIQLLDESYYEQQLKPLLLEKFTTAYISTFRKHQVNVDEPLVEDENSSLTAYILGGLSPAVEKTMLAYLADKTQLKEIILIAKGWLAHGILYHVLHAKYRVNYGLNTNSTAVVYKPVAIPFQGKDLPSARSEFSHPDVMLGFTIISYLYQGLSPSQLKCCLHKLKDKFSAQVADKMLSAWLQGHVLSDQLRDPTFPHWLTSFENIDLADEQCLTQLHLHLANNMHAIYFYLNQFVFPEEAFQYRYKISANAHSLVGYNRALGFSGTDDRKITMPHQVLSLRSQSQQGTNGKLLAILTQPRNSAYHALAVNNTRELLKAFCEYANTRHNCHALLDAGALITGFSNYDVAEFLIAHLSDSLLGVIYFDDATNNLMVLTRDAVNLPLADCHISKQHLFAYLDDVHTRGTDLKLPLDCHGILTVGIGMHKDKLTQAAMRLRQLAQNQSISLWGTQKVTLAIARDNHINPGSINSLEVIRWVTRNSIQQINADLFPVAVRKINFEFLRKAEELLKTAPTTIDTLIQYCQEQELFALEDFYALSPQVEDLADYLYLIVAKRVKGFWQALKQELVDKQLADSEFYQTLFTPSNKRAFRETLYSICTEIADYLEESPLQSALDNDQEKEVEVEIIQEQNTIVSIEQAQPQREHLWNANLILQSNFIKVANGQAIIRPSKDIASYIKVPAHLHTIHWHADIYMTQNYLTSIQTKVNQALDYYLRPVDVVLIHRVADKSLCILLSGQEAAMIRSQCYNHLENNLLVHIEDINGPTQLPVNSRVTKQEQKLLTIVKLFTGNCQYPETKENHRLAKRVGRILPDCFINPAVEIDKPCSEKLYGLLIEQGYLDHAGIMTNKLLQIFTHDDPSEVTSIILDNASQQHSKYVFKKLVSIYNKLIVEPSVSLSKSHHTLWEWVRTRGKLKEYQGSELESVLDTTTQLNM